MAREEYDHLKFFSGKLIEHHYDLPFVLAYHLFAKDRTEEMDSKEREDSVNYYRFYTSEERLFTHKPFDRLINNAEAVFELQSIYSSRPMVPFSNSVE